MKEVWKTIRGYKNYQVSNLGRVKSITRYRKGKSNSLVYVPEKMLKGKVDKDGYIVYALCTGKHKNMTYHRAHRLVYEAFYGKAPYWMVVNHINENKNDNSLSNLNIMTVKQNNCWGTRIERVSEKMTNGKLSKPTIQFDLDGNFVKEWLSTKEIERQLGFKNSYISGCCKGKYKKAYGYIWKYK